MESDHRYEFKYIIDDHKASIIYSYLKKIGLKKSKVKEGLYPVTSLYFDTPSLSDYHDKISGLKNRKKLRARIYGQDFKRNNEGVWLELKQKHDMNIVKERCSISDDKWIEYVEEGNPTTLSTALKENKTLDKFSYLMLYKSYSPHIVVRYKRIVYEENFLSKIRLTFDRDIETCKWKDLMDNRGAISVHKGYTVLEIKFKKALPWWFKDMVRRFELKRETFSKYTNSVDAINRHHQRPR